jgi:alginate O-acetyltransferase complex protein AlgI
MAIGLGLMLGFVFPKNFNSPYHAASITEFWQRWHISLSTWLREYLYIPLGGNRRGSTRTYVNLGLVMLIGGLWHGAAWTFLIWGGIHGLFLAGERFLKQHFSLRLPTLMKQTLTFSVVCVAWVFFRANSLPDALQMVHSLFGGESDVAGELIPGLIYTPYFMGSLALAAAVTWLAPQTWDWSRNLPAWKIAFVVFALFSSVAYMTIQAFNPFIDFIF